VLLISDQRWVLMHELRGAPEPSLDEQIARFSDCDLVLVEGFKETPIPKLEVHRPSVGKPLIAGTGVETIVAVATDDAGSAGGADCAADTRTQRPRRDRGFHPPSPGVPQCLITTTHWRACWRAPRCWHEHGDVATHAAAGRVLAEGLRSNIDVPPLDNTSMDGYALRLRDVPASATKLVVAQRIPAGSVGHTLARRARRRAFSPARRCRPAPMPW
jgi:hypothetical protein